MTNAAQLQAFTQSSWKSFAAAWRKLESKGSEEALHDLRVSMRRLMASRELRRALGRSGKSARLRRVITSLLDRTAKLRDVQVQLREIPQLGRNDMLDKLIRSLKRREKREIVKVRRGLKRSTRRSVARDVENICQEFRRWRKMSDTRVDAAVDDIIRRRVDKFAKCRFRFDPTDLETLHRMRIALKKLRYVMEAADWFSTPSAMETTASIQEFQRLMGDLRDVELLRGKIEKWASRRGKSQSVASIIGELDGKRKRLLQDVIDFIPVVDQLLSLNKPKPISEKTSVVEAGKSGSDESSASATAVPDVVSLDEKNHHLRDIGGMVAHALEFPDHKNQS
jgi:CHAD domain-containing protein